MEEPWPQQQSLRGWVPGQCQGLVTGSSGPSRRAEVAFTGAEHKGFRLNRQTQACPTRDPTGLPCTPGIPKITASAKDKGCCFPRGQELEQPALAVDSGRAELERDQGTRRNPSRHTQSSASRPGCVWLHPDLPSLLRWGVCAVGDAPQGGVAAHLPQQPAPQFH